MKEMRALIARLDRIEDMERGQEHPALILRELELLTVEVELWLSHDPAADPAREAFHNVLQALGARARADRGSSQEAATGSALPVIG